MTKSLRELRTTGFQKLQDGRIHLRCFTCGRKQSNTPRESYDPANARLIETECAKCGQGSKGDFAYYYDAHGNEVEMDEPRARTPESHD